MGTGGHSHLYLDGGYHFPNRYFRAPVPRSGASGCQDSGRLLHTNVFGCTLFAAISGSSTATTATVGKITVPELRKRDYSMSLAAGSLAGAGSFGLLIPPSIAMIIYGVLAEVSIAKLFIAGIVPGMMMAALYSGYIAIMSIAFPHMAPKYEGDVSGRAILKGLGELVPIAALMFVVLGSIYSALPRHPKPLPSVYSALL